jgi:hypothetical protein
VPTAETGALSTPVVGRGLAYADYDRDGDPDVVITQVGRRPLLLRNDRDSAATGCGSKCRAQATTAMASGRRWR